MRALFCILLAILLSGCWGRPTVKGGELRDLEVSIKTPPPATAPENPGHLPSIGEEPAPAPSLGPVPMAEVQIPGVGTFKAPAGSEITVKNKISKQPDNPEEAATIAPDGGMSTGTTQAWSQTLGALGPLPIIGSIFVLLGALAFVFAFKFPLMIPKMAGPIVVLCGFGLIAAPTFIDRYSWIFAIAVVVVLGILVLWVLRKMGITQSTADQTMKGIQRLKKKHPDLKEEINSTLEAEQDNAVKDAIKKRKRDLK